MISNALNGNQNQKDVEEEKTENYHSNGSKNSQNGKKDSANDQLQGEQKKSKVTCEQGRTYPLGK